MAIEIRELIIKTTLSDQSEGEENEEDEEPGQGRLTAADTQAIIMQCVESVLNILQGREER